MRLDDQPAPVVKSDPEQTRLVRDRAGNSGVEQAKPAATS
jgi:hypothetical protein